MRRLYWLLLIGCVTTFGAAGYRWYGWSERPAARHARSARQLSAQGNSVQAAREWQIAAALEPRMVEAREALGKVYLADGAVALAIREFRIVTELEPRRPHAYCQVAEALHAGGLGDLALGPARYVARAEPRCLRARRTLGLIAGDQEDYITATRELEAALPLGPRDAGVRMALARLYLGLGQLPRAEAQARAAHDVQPENVEGAYLLAHTLVQQGDRSRASEAETLLRTALAGDRNHAAAALDLGQVLLWKGQPLAARRELERAAALAPRDPEPLQRLAEVHTELKDLPAAARLRKKAEQVAAARLSRLEMERKLAQNPLDGRLLYDLGDFYARDRQYFRALELLSRAGDILYDDPTVQRRLIEVRNEASRSHPEPPGGLEGRS